MIVELLRGEMLIVFPCMELALKVTAALIVPGFRRSWLWDEEPAAGLRASESLGRVISLFAR